jgi:hypothetical protein
MATQASPTIEATARQSPGEAFAQAFASAGERAQVTFDYTVTDAFQPTKERPRVTVRNLFKKVPLDGEVARFWCEDRPASGRAGAVHEAELRREAAFRFGMAQARAYPIDAWVQLPPELAPDRAGLAAFIDFRLLVRLATAENQALTRAPHGLLGHPGIARLPYADGYVNGLLAACDEIEQTGATAHAMIVNPRDYYHHLVGHDGVLADLARSGTLICRTRMVAPGCALVGDFAMAARLLDGARSVIGVAQPPPGTFAEPGLGLAVRARIHEGLAIHLPTHFFVIEPAVQVP